MTQGLKEGCFLLSFALLGDGNGHFKEGALRELLTTHNLKPESLWES